MRTIVIPDMEATTVKIEPQDIKTEPESDSGLPKKKKSPGRPKKLKQEKITDHVVVVKKKRDRFKGMSEEEVAAKFLPDHLASNLDIVIIGINPGLFAAFTGHHYAGPGNHFWKCMYLSGLIPEPMNALQDFKLLDFGIGFTNIVARTTKGSPDLSKKEIKEGAVILTEKLLKYKPKIAVFNGKGIYEVFVGHKNFYFGKQPELLPGTETAVFVMPSSSARCSQLPRAVDKVPFYEALKKFRDHLNGKLPNLDHSEVCFPDLALKTAVKKEVKTEGYDEISPQEMEAQINQAADSYLSQFTQGNYQVIPYSSPSDLPNLPNMNGPLVSQIKQEPQECETTNLSQTKKSRAPRKKKKSQESSQANSSPANVSQPLSSSVSSQQKAQDNVSYSLPPGSVSGNISQPFSHCNGLPQIKQEPQDDYVYMPSEYSSTTNSQLPSQLNGGQEIKQEPQDNILPSMPPLQQYAKVKQEPEDSWEPSCAVSQSDAPSYSKYLSLDQSDPLSQNGNTVDNHFNSFLQGMYGMVSKVANQQQSNYGMVSLTNQTSFADNQPLQFNEALCGIVKDSSYDMDDYGSTVIKTETKEEKKPKQKTRKRKSNTKPASTVTSPAEENEHSSHSSPGSSSQSYHPVTTNETYPQHNPHLSHSSQSNAAENYPQNPHSISHPHSISQDQGHNAHSIYSHQNYPPYPPGPTTLYQPDSVNGNHFQQSDHFSPSMPSFSQMMAQDSDIFRMYQYGKDFHQTHGPMPNMGSSMPGHGYPYSVPGYERWGYPSVPSTVSDPRMPTSAISSQASSDSAMDLTQAVNKPGSNFEAKSAEDAEYERELHQNMVVKEEKSDH